VEFGVIAIGLLERPARSLFHHHNVITESAMLSRTHFISFMDQALFSASNFMLSIGLVRVFHETEYAGYGIALAIAMLIQAVQRGFNIQASLLSSEQFSHKARALLGAHVIMLSVALVIPLIAYVCLRGAGVRALTSDIAAATVACVAIFFQIDVNRIFLIKRDRQVWSLAVSALVLASYIAVIALGYTGAITFQQGMLGLAVSLVAVSAAIAWRGIRADFREGWRELLNDLKAVIAWTTFGTAASTAYSALPVFLLGALQAPIYTAGYVATRNLLQPLQVLVRGFDIADKHLFSGRTDRNDFRSGVMWPIIRNMLASLLYAMPVYVFAEPLLTLVYGQKLAAFAPALQFWTVVFIVMSPILPLESIIYDRRGAKGYSIGIIICGIATSAAIYPLVHTWSVTGAIAGVLLGCSLHLCVACVMARDSRSWLWRRLAWRSPSLPQNMVRDVEVGRLS
jgi:O-antigen/teichoic acid export membrane protein